MTFRVSNSLGCFPQYSRDPPISFCFFLLSNMAAKAWRQEFIIAFFLLTMLLYLKSARVVTSLLIACEYTREYPDDRWVSHICCYVSWGNRSVRFYVVSIGNPGHGIIVFSRLWKYKSLIIGSYTIHTIQIIRDEKFPFNTEKNEQFIP